MSENTLIVAQGVLTNVRILAASALRSSLIACANAVNVKSGVGFDVHWGTSGAVNKRLNDGEKFDLVAGAREALLQLGEAGRVSGDIFLIGASKLAMGVRAEDAAVDISSAAAFKKALLDARMISRGDPAGGGTAGNHLVKVFAQLGVSEVVAGKSILRTGGFDVMKEVAENRADFGLTQSTEIPAVEGVKIGAYLPAEVQLETIYAIAAGATSKPEASAFLEFLKGSQARAIVAGAGFAPA